VARETLSGEALAAGAGALLGDARIAERLSRFRAALTPAQGVERAADFLQHVARAAPLRAAGSTSELRRAGKSLTARSARS
jgi:hypothetical protein